jgi:hypothetical protein
MCPVGESNRRQGPMDFQLFSSLVDQIAQIPQYAGGECRPEDWCSPYCVGLHGYGEPLLNKHFVKYVEYLQSAGIKRVCFTTNGSLLTPTLAKQLLNFKFSFLEVSVETLDSASYERIRKNLIYDRTNLNVRNFLALRNERGSKQVIGLKLIVDNFEQRPSVDRVRDIFPGLQPGDVVVTSGRHNFGRKAFQSISSTQPSNNPCGLLWTQIMVLTDGRALACCADMDGEQFIVGDARSESLVSIFNSDRFEHFRALHTSGQRHTIPMCSICNICEIPGANEVVQ